MGLLRHRKNQDRDKPRFVHANTIPLTFLAFMGGQLDFLKQKGFDVAIITSEDDLLDVLRKREQVAVHVVQMNRSISPCSDLIALYDIWKWLVATRPTIVQAATPKAGMLVMVAARLAGVPVPIFFMRGLRYMGLEGWRRVATKSMEVLTCRCADVVFCTSPSLMRFALDERLCAPSKIRVVHHGTGNGVDSGRFDPERFTAEERVRIRSELGLRPDQPILLFAGRPVLEKGVVELVEAWQVVRERFPEAQLLIAGPTGRDDPMPSEVRRRLFADDRIHFLGYVADMAPIFAISDVLLLPTHREGFGLVALEAAAMRVPTVASRIVGVVDAIADGETGILVPRGDARAFASAVTTLFEQPELAARMGEKGRERVVRNFRPEDIWAALYREYEMLLRRRGIVLPRPDDADSKPGAGAERPSTES